MSDKTKSRPVLLRSLLRKQHKHEIRLARIERAEARLERQKEKFKALEARIAELEQLLVRPPHKEPGRDDSSDSKLKRVRLIFNPEAGPKARHTDARFAEVVGCLRAHGIEANVGLKTSGHAARQLARKAARDGEPLVIVAAGDGTIAEVAAQLVGSATTLGVVPIGTMNNIARSLGIPLGIDDACALLGMGTARHVDVGRVYTKDNPRGEYFIESTGIGLSAIGVFAGQAIEKRQWRLVPQALRKYFDSKLGKILVEMDDKVLEATTRMVTVSNSPLVGSNLLAAPSAKMDDGLLDVYVYDGMGDAALVDHFAAASSGKAGHLQGYQTRRVRITVREDAPAEPDGSVTPKEHVIEIEVVPKALSMIVGNGIALGNPVEAAPPAPTFAPPPSEPRDPGHSNGATGTEKVDVEIAET
jgi:YegS/Rv2252/BmrU family lipid kinase